MTEVILDTKALPETLFRIIHTEKVRMTETNGIIQIMPVILTEETDCTVGLRGLFANYPEMSVEKFLERKRADKELEL